MTTRLSREHTRTSALDHLHTRATELARFASNPATALRRTTATRSTHHTSRRPTRRLSHRAGRLHTRRAHVARWRRNGVAMGPSLFAGLGSATIVGDAAIADSDSAPNSVPRLRRRAGARAPRSHATPRGRRRDLGRSRRARILAGRLRRRRVRLRPRRVLRFDRHERLNAPIVGIASTPNGPRLLARRRRRRSLRLRQRHSTDRWSACRSRRRSSPSSPPTTVTATGSSAPTAECSRSVTPASTARPERSHSPARSSARRRPLGHGYWLVGSDGGVFAFGDAVLPRLPTRTRRVTRSVSRRHPVTATGSPTPTAACAVSALRSRQRRVDSRPERSAPEHRRHRAQRARWLLAGRGRGRPRIVARQRSVPRLHPRTSLRARVATRR